MDKKELERAVDILIGEGLLKAGDLDVALEIYKQVDEKIPGGLLRLCGDTCIEQGRYEAALRAYELAGTSWVTKDRYIKLGDSCIKTATKHSGGLKEAYLDDAKKVYERALTKTI